MRVPRRSVAPAGGTAIVWRKELLDAVRDRRSLLTTLMYGAWGPLVMALALVAIARDRDPDADLVVAIAGRQHAPSLAAFLEGQRATLEDAPPDARAAVRDRVVPAVLIVDEPFPRRFAEAREASVTLVFSSAWPASSARARRIRDLVEAYERRTAAVRLVMRGVAPSVASPLRLEEQDVSTPADRAGTALAMLPIFLLVAAFVGGMNVAADNAAGERERGSLEALLMTPVSRWQLAAGKWAAALTVNLATVALTIAVASLVLRHPRVQGIDLPVGLALSDATAIMLVLTPLAALAPAAQILIALFASTYKEAQSQLSLLLFAPMLPGFLLAFGTLEPQAWMRAAPVVGQHLMVADLLRGVAPAAGPTFALAAATLGAAFLALAATARCLGDERIVRGRV